MKERASEDETLNAWDDLKRAIERVECALPSQMTAAMDNLIDQKRAFDRLLMRMG